MKQTCLCFALIYMFFRWNYCPVQHWVETAGLLLPDIARQEMHQANFRISIVSVRRGCPDLSPAGKEWQNHKCQVPQHHLSIFPSLLPTALMSLTDTGSDCIGWWVIDMPCLGRTSLWLHMVLYALPGCLLLWGKGALLMTSEGAEAYLAKSHFAESYSAVLVSNLEI